MRSRKQCRTSWCRAWTYELAKGRPCPYCHKVDTRAVFWLWADRIAFVAAFVAVAAVGYVVTQL